MITCGELYDSMEPISEEEAELLFGQKHDLPSLCRGDYDGYGKFYAVDDKGRLFLFIKFAAPPVYFFDGYMLDYFRWRRIDQYYSTVGNIKFDNFTRL
jgi:hypothetical protein